MASPHLQVQLMPMNKVHIEYDNKWVLIDSVVCVYLVCDFCNVYRLKYLLLQHKRKTHKDLSMVFTVLSSLGFFSRSLCHINYKCYQ